MTNMSKLKKVISMIFSAKKSNRMSTSSETAQTISPSSLNTVRPSRPLKPPTVQNYLLIWLDEKINQVNNADCQNTMKQLQEVVNTVNTFTDVNECVDFIKNIKDEKIFMISSGAYGEKIVPIVHDMPQVSTIYIFCGNKSRHDPWAKQCLKVKGVFTEITLICQALKQVTQECDQNIIPMSFVVPRSGTTDQNLNQLDQSFMYTQILKEILLTIDFEQQHIDEFVKYCREQFVGNTMELKNIDKLEREYHAYCPIWWYTHHRFLYSMLNHALRNMEVDLIINMGFFVRHLHNSIVQLHLEQNAGHTQSTTFTVYRGQGLSQADFNQLLKSKGGLMSFNSFLSTSRDRTVSLAFAESNQFDPDLIGVLFEITMNSSISSRPFAKIRDLSHFQGEEEILLSMHSVFRIGQIKQIDGNERLWEVKLIFTNDNDPELQALTERLREEICSDKKGSHRLGNLQMQLGQFGKAERIYELMLTQASDDHEISSIYYMLGMTKRNQGEYAEAIRFYEKSLEIDRRTLPSTHPDLAATYTNIGLVYQNMGEYKKALSSNEEALEIFQKILPPYHPDLATPYNNIGSVYDKLNQDSIALSFYEKALKIYQKSLPPNHPSLATSYDNIGKVLNKMEDYSRALSSQEKALDIRRKSLPPNHPQLAWSFNNIGSVYDTMGDYSKALTFYERALDIGQRSLPAKHPHLQTYKKNVELEKRKVVHN
jgi:tetratricopeptide (TPR) repeat protein